MDKQLERLSRIRSAMIVREPFFGVLATKLDLVENYQIDTASTDGRTIQFNPAFTVTLSDDELKGLLVHEVSHCTNQHFARLKWRNLELAQQAADYAINLPIVEAGYTLLPEAFIDDRFRGMGFEDIYTILESEQDQDTAPDNQQGQDGDSGDTGDAGQQSGDAGDTGADSGQSQDTGEAGNTGDNPVPGTPGNDPGKCGGFHVPEPGADPDTGDSTQDAQDLAREWELATRQAANIAAKQAGEMPGHIKSIVDDLNRPQINYREALADFINDMIQSDYSFSKPNKRYLGTGFSMPSLVPDGVGEIVLFTDTSGSLNKRAHKACMAELQAMLDSGFIARLHVIQGDTALTHAANYESGETASLEIFGGGGTDFRDCMAYIAREHSDAAAMIAFTDLEVKPAKIGIDPGIPTLWAVWGPSTRYEAKTKLPQFGECMPILEN